mgnify:FL=1
MERFDCAIVGAGLGGLLCAAGLAQRGKRVVVLERAARAGGRARSQITGGFVLNQGPHAVYRGGATEALLTELGVPLSAGLATARGGVLVSSEGTHAFPRGALSLLGTSALGLRGKVQVARVLAGLGEARRRLEPQISVAAWLTSLGLEPRAERVMRALCRLATYVDAPDELSAQAAAIARHAATAGGVLYVHAGWQSIVDGLTAELRDAEVRFGASVRRVAFWVVVRV